MADIQNKLKKNVIRTHVLEMRQDIGEYGLRGEKYRNKSLHQTASDNKPFIQHLKNCCITTCQFSPPL